MNKTQNSWQCGRTLQPAYLLVLLAGIMLLTNVGTTQEAHSATYYLAPNGTNSNFNGSSSRPWQTFAFAIPKLRAGDTLILKDGTYTGSNSGYPTIQCGSRRSQAQNGTRTSPITIKAEHERQAFISGTGSRPAFSIRNCSHWKIEGVHARSRDNKNFSGVGGHVFFVGGSSNLTFTRLLLHHNNRYGNTHLLLAFNSNNILVEESEFYSFHRHSIIFAHTKNSVARRNYANSRGHADILGGWKTLSKTRGGTGLAIYPGSNNIAENNISEGQRTGVSISAAGTTIGNRLLGNISLNEYFGVRLGARGSGTSRMPIDTVIENSVIVNSRGRGIFARGAKRTQVKNVTVSGGWAGIVADFQPANPGDGFYSIFTTNTLVNNIRNVGFKMLDQDEFSNRYPSTYNPRTDFFPNFNYFNERRDDPRLGTCKVFIPRTSTVKGRGAGGDDIGANILFRYENGRLTSQRLWDSQTGAFPGGARISGVNDISGSSLFDVHRRLNVNTNGCSLP